MDEFVNPSSLVFNFINSASNSDIFVVFSLIVCSNSLFFAISASQFLFSVTNFSFNEAIVCCNAATSSLFVVDFEMSFILFSNIFIFSRIVNNFARVALLPLYCSSLFDSKAAFIADNSSFKLSFFASKSLLFARILSNSALLFLIISSKATFASLTFLNSESSFSNLESHSCNFCTST